MNINYAQIIKKANARKDALMAVEERMKSARHHYNALSDALVFFARLNNDVSVLDDEAKQLMGEPLLNDIFVFTHYVTNFASILNKPRSGNNPASRFLAHFPKDSA